MIININYAMFETFGTIDGSTGGGPAGATNTLVYKVYADGFLGLNIGSSAAQSVILMLIVIALTAVQFRWVERRVQY
ncbi:sn-glycerol-3-phosphate transport system permease protein UgpA [compost metagenome]